MRDAMAMTRCDWCGAEDPRWLKHVDQSLTDTIYRQYLGRFGPTSTVVRACEDCKPKMDAAYPPGSQNL